MLAQRDRKVKRLERAGRLGSSLGWREPRRFMRGQVLRIGRVLFPPFRARPAHIISFWTIYARDVANQGSEEVRHRCAQGHGILAVRHDTLQRRSTAVSASRNEPGHFRPHLPTILLNEPAKLRPSRGRRPHNFRSINPNEDRHRRSPACPCAGGSLHERRNNPKIQSQRA
jgi:hypothetical protein